MELMDAKMMATVVDSDLDEDSEGKCNVPSCIYSAGCRCILHSAGVCRMQKAVKVAVMWVMVMAHASYVAFLHHRLSISFLVILFLHAYPTKPLSLVCLPACILFFIHITYVLNLCSVKHDIAC